ncbi:retrovirus-related pol polyprotein from transposon TNT 1-94 [Tanacetum coccineum]
MSSNSDDIQAAGSDTRPPMLDRTDYESWSQRIRLYCRGKENGLLILQSIDQGPFEFGTTRNILGTTPKGGVPGCLRFLSRHLSLGHCVSVTEFCLYCHELTSVDLSVVHLAQSFRATLPQMNNQLRTSSNTRNQATIQDGRVVVQNVQGRQNQNQNQRYFARGNGAAGNGGAQNRAGNANAGQDAQLQQMVQDQPQQKDLLQTNAQLQHLDVLKRIDDPKMMVNDFPMVPLDQWGWILMDWLEQNLQFLIGRSSYGVLLLGHNLFSIGQFCDSDLEVAFRKHTCFIRDLDGVDLIKGSRCTNLYTISVEDTMRKATHKPKTTNTITEVLHTLHMDLCRPLRVQSINGKKYIFVIVDDYSRFIWVKFLRSKDETPAFVINLLKQIQVGLNKTVWFVRTDNGTEFVNKDLTDYYESIVITHEKTVLRIPWQNGIVEQRNHTLVEAAWTMLIFYKAPLALCYPTNDSEDLGKLKAKANIGFFVGYAPNRKGYRIYNKRARQIMETIHITFDELTEQTAPVHSSPGPAHNLLMPGPISSELVPNPPPAAPYVPPTNKEL